jgi:hypothetical protein
MTRLRVRFRFVQALKRLSCADLTPPLSSAESGPTNSMSTDAFHTHFGPSPSILSPSTTFSAQNGKWTTSRSQRPGLGRVVSQVPDASPSTSESDDVKVKLVDTVYAQFRKLPSFKTTGKGEMTDLQASVHEVLGQYKDMYLSKLDISKREEVRDVVLMHAVNHVLKCVPHSHIRFCKTPRLTRSFRFPGLDDVSSR